MKKIVFISVILFLVLVLIQDTAKADTSFYRKLIKKTWASNYDAVRMVYGLIARKDKDMKFEDYVKFLKSKNVLDKDLTLKRDTFVTKGVLACMICKALKIKGGVIMRIFGISERYALRECNHIGLLDKAVPYHRISGKELISTIILSNNYKKKKGKKEKGE